MNGIISEEGREVVFVLKSAAMKSLLFLTTFFLALTSCRRDFSSFLQKAEQAFLEKNYITTIDELNLGLPNWKESDGAESKARAYELLGKSYHHLRNTDKAIEAYQQAIRLSNTTYDSATALGNLLLARSQHQRAMKAFEAALRMRPSEPSAYLGLGHCLYAERKYTEAERAYSQVIEHSPSVKEALECLALVREKLAIFNKRGGFRHTGNRRRR